MTKPAKRSKNAPSISDEACFKAFCEMPTDHLGDLRRELEKRGTTVGARRLESLNRRHSWVARKAALRFGDESGQAKALVDRLCENGADYDQPTALKGILSRITAEVSLSLQMDKGKDYLLGLTEAYERFTDLYNKSMQHTLEAAGRRMIELDELKNATTAKENAKADESNISPFTGKPTNIKAVQK